MDPERLAQKLRPLIPREVDRWLRAREAGDPELRALVDHQIAAAARRLLAHANGRPLLSLPPERLIRGAFNLGTILYDKEKWPAGITPGELLQNLAVYGRSGSGKTNVVFHLIEQLVDRHVPFVLLDWKRTGRHLIPLLPRRIPVYTAGRPLAPFPFNPFLPPPGMDEHVYIAHVVDVMAEAYSLGDGAISLLERALTACYDNGAVTVGAVQAALDAIPDKGRVHGWKVSAQRALGSMAFAQMAGSGSQEEVIASLFHESAIIELDALGSNATRFLVPLLCLWLYRVKLAASTREELALVLIVEEAHHVLHRRPGSSRESVMEMLLRQCRELGIAIVVVDQHPHLISSAALGNTYTSICLNLKDPADLTRAAALSGVGDEDRRALSRLPVGHGVVKLQDRWTRPFLVRFPRVDVPKGRVTDTVLARLQEGSGTGSAWTAAVAGNLGRVRRGRLDGFVLSEEEVALIEDVAAQPDDGVKARYLRLGLSAEKGTRLQRALIRAGWLESAVIPVGRSRKVVLRLTAEGRAALGLDASPPRLGSIRHEYWKRHYARVYADQGYTVTMEAPRGAGRVDVLAVRNSERIGIEIETGRSDAVENVRAGLTEGLNRIIVVATDAPALAKVEQQLRAAGLLSRSRVALRLRERPVARPKP